MHRIIYYYKGFSYKAHIKSSKAALQYILSLRDRPIGFAMTKRTVEESPSSYGYYLVDGSSLTTMGKSDFFEYISIGG